MFYEQLHSTNTIPRESETKDHCSFTFTFHCSFTFTFHCSFTFTFHCSFTLTFHGSFTFTVNKAFMHIPLQKSFHMSHAKTEQWVAPDACYFTNRYSP